MHRALGDMYALLLHPLAQATRVEKRKFDQLVKACERDRFNMAFAR